MKDFRRRDIDPRVIPGGTILVGERMATFKRFYRWFNLTIIQHGVWPLLVILTGATATQIEWTPVPWYWARLAAPAVAALVAWLYLKEPPPAEALVRHEDDPPLLAAAFEPEVQPEGIVARQVRFFVLGLSVMLAIALLVSEPFVPAAKIMALGLAEVAAYHLINFGVVPSSYLNRDRGMAVGTLLFALSWGIHDLLLVAVGTEEASVALAFVGGCALGGIVAVASRLLMRWPGGRLTAPAAHWLVIYLIFGVAM